MYNNGDTAMQTQNKLKYSSKALKPGTNGEKKNLM